MFEQGLFPLRTATPESQNIKVEMIGKLLKWFRKKEEPKVEPRVSPYNDPLYPPDLAEMFPENRTETHTDNCLWYDSPPKDK
jgi:hypothetical protein